jgi:hypothetical protein
MVCAVDTPVDRDLYCPRCRYNLRGLTTPRCPECGLTFPDGQWAAGILREQIPTRLDRCDLRQPHQVLARSLYELIRGGLRPGRLLTKLDLDGRLVPAGLMFVFGVAWLYLLMTALLATATCMHTGVSPAAGVRSAALYWSPRVLRVTIATSLATFGCAVQPAALRVSRLTRRQYFRLAGYWVPCAGVLVVIPLALMLAVPELVLHEPGIVPLLTGLPGLVGVLGGAVRRRRAMQEAARSTGLQAALGLAGLGGWMVLIVWLARRVLPTELEPPLWIYF